MIPDKLFFFEQTDFSLRFARCVITETSLNIEDLKEVVSSDEAGLAALAPAGTQAVCALRPKSRQIHLASVDDAKRYSGLAGLQQFAQLPALAKNEPAWFAGVQASDGALPTNAPWIMSISSAAAYQQARAIFEGIKLKPARCLDATLATVGAVSSTITGPTLLIDIGELSSNAFLLGPDGVLGVRTVSLNLDQIADAVQAELGLKFRGSAAKLFFNPDCDFTDTGAKIAARLSATLKTDLAPLLSGLPAPVAFSCSGLPALQQWLEVQLASAFGITLHVPDFKGWCTAVGVTFGTPSIGANLPTAWFNFLHFINSQTLESPVSVPWQAEWLSIKSPIAGTKAVTTPPVAAPRPATPTTPAIPIAPAVVAPGAASKGEAVPPSPVKPASAPTPAKGTPAAPTASNKPAPAVAAAKQAAAPATPAKPAPATPAKPAASPAPAKAAVSSIQYSAKPAAASTATASARKEGGKNKMPIYIGIGVLVLLLLGGGYFYQQSQEEEKARIAIEKQKADQRAEAEREKARLAEQKAREEAESRKRFELETSQKLAQAENARKQAEEEARAQAATRLANARGTLVVNTQPAGATVTVGNLPSQVSPATFSFLKIGKYPVTIALAHHEETKLELEVTENNTTDSGIIQLASLVGAVSISSEPAGSNFEIRPANSFIVAAEAKRTGQTPATLNDLDPGDYAVTFTRAGWAPHTENVTIARNATASTSWTFPSGIVKISSSPAGASVSLDGVKIGVTPLTLRQPPGSAKFELKLAFHDPLSLSGLIVEGKTLELNGVLSTADVIFGPGELDKNPEPINPKTPDLPASLTLVEGKVVIGMTINRDGTPADLKIVRSSNPELGKLYLAALAKWKFKPGIKDGKPVRSAVVVPFLISASKD